MKRYGVRLSVPALADSNKPSAAALRTGLLLWARRPGDIHRLLQSWLGSECGQCHVVSVRRRLNTLVMCIVLVSKAVAQ